MELELHLPRTVENRAGQKQRKTNLYNRVVSGFSAWFFVKAGCVSSPCAPTAVCCYIVTFSSM